MADLILFSELQDWYNTWNSVITNYGGGLISTLSVPSQGTAKASDINLLYTKLSDFKNDEYLSTEPTLYNVE